MFGHKLNYINFMSNFHPLEVAGRDSETTSSRWKFKKEA